MNIRKYILAIPRNYTFDKTTPTMLYIRSMLIHKGRFKYYTIVHAIRQKMKEHL